ncbi:MULTISPECIES: hypothetical protein [Cupriavidus]|uniref:Glycoside hydrolase family 19 protein n=1 Tax=Cupriavidus campinensis TaxID=151783 RepID=A0AAE9I547_9BURK|nr:MULTISPECIES: hypothetical protein [Cupriavidus]URF04191.1 hypothetical protein M5D45_17245 [Cupriavidus campinensis]
MSEGTGPFTQEGLCDIDALKTLMKDRNPGHNPYVGSSANKALRYYVQMGKGVRERLRGLVCEMPSEWDGSNNEARYRKLKEPGEFYGGDPAGYGRFMAFVGKAQFWDKTGLPPTTTEKLWFFHPLAFIRHFRKCGWLSESDLTGILHSAPSAGQRRAITLRRQLGSMANKYLITSRLRLAHFLSQVGHETGWWQHREEIGNERYFRTMYEIISSEAAAADFRSGLAHRLGVVRRDDTELSYAGRRPAEILLKAQGMDNGAANRASGGTAGDGAKFKGRGFLQITGRRNYRAYGKYKARDFLSDSNPTIIALDDSAACDTSGYFWVREVANREADKGAGREQVQRIGGLVNRGAPHKRPKHLEDRLQKFRVIWGRVNDQ